MNKIVGSVSIEIQEISTLTEEVACIHPATSKAVQFVPAISNHIGQGSYYASTPGLTLRRVHGPAIVSSRSDLVRIGDHGILEKMFRPTVERNIFLDQHFLERDLDKKKIRIRDLPISGRIKKGYSLLGVHSGHWGHFIAEYYPSFLAALPFLESQTCIILPEGLDEVLLELLKHAVRITVPDKILFFYICPDRASVLVDELFIADKASLLTDHSSWVSMYDIIVQAFCHGELRRFTTSLKQPRNTTAYEKIFLTRRGLGRSAVNLQEVEDFFTANGYAIIDPSNMNSAERADIFSECKELSGIFASSFFNLLYCKSIEKVKIITPFARCLDQVFLNLFRPPEFTYFLANSLDDSIGPNMFISKNTCKSLIVG